jgi:FdrA protein
MSSSKINKLLDEPLQVVNIGLEGFAKELEQQGVKVVHVDWAPPAGGDPKLANLLSKLGA